MATTTTARIDVQRTHLEPMDDTFPVDARVGWFSGAWAADEEEDSSSLKGGSAKAASFVGTRFDIFRIGVGLEAMKTNAGSHSSRIYRNSGSLLFAVICSYYFIHLSLVVGGNMESSGIAILGAPPAQPPVSMFHVVCITISALPPLRVHFAHISLTNLRVPLFLERLHFLDEIRDRATLRAQQGMNGSPLSSLLSTNQMPSAKTGKMQMLPSNVQRMKLGLRCPLRFGRFACF